MKYLLFILHSSFFLPFAHAQSLDDPDNDDEDKSSNDCTQHHFSSVYLAVVIQHKSWSEREDQNPEQHSEHQKPEYESTQPTAIFATAFVVFFRMFVRFVTAITSDAFTRLKGL